MEPSRGWCKNEMEIVSRQGGEADGGRGAEDMLWAINNSNTFSHKARS